MKYIFSLLCFTIFGLNAYTQTDRIIINVPLLYPEGIAYDSATNHFFVSSARMGIIGTLDMKGNYKLFYEDSVNVKSSFGMKVDAKRRKLWICTGDPNYSIYHDSATYKKMIHLIALDLQSGKKVDDIDLSTLYNGKHFLNDLSLDDAGNIYLTDSYSPVIYKVDAGKKATVFAQHELFKGRDIGLNGIVWHPSGYLLTVNNNDGSILKVDIKNPGNVSKVDIKNFFPGADGLLLDKDNNLILIQNKGVNKAFKIKSNDNWKTAAIESSTVMEDRFQNPSTATIVQGKIYALNAKLNELNDPTLPPSKEFSVQLISLQPLK